MYKVLYHFLSFQKRSLNFCRFIFKLKTLSGFTPDYFINLVPDMNTTELNEKKAATEKF